jgi:glyoxalase family protein
MRTRGIHHITAIASEPRRNLAFYTNVLGLRLVKRTVNFDDPGSYHFYFGDNVGTPGTIITFFPWPGAPRGVRGSGQVVVVSFEVPRESFDFWKARLRDNNAEEIAPRFDESVLRFVDPDGLLIELVMPSVADKSPDQSLKVAPRDLSTSFHSGRDDEAGHAIRGFAAPTLQVSRPSETEKLLHEILGLEFVAEENKRRRFRGNGNTAASFIDIMPAEERPGRIAAGTVHHIAFRAADDEEQLRWREQLVETGFAVSPVMERNYFRSIYFREPSGILFEIATDGPGFVIDEPVESLRETLKLPPAYEAMRSEIERVLPPLNGSRDWLASAAMAEQE